MSSMGDTLIGMGRSIPEAVRARALAEAARKRQAEKDVQDAEQNDMVKTDWLVKRAAAQASADQATNARTALDTTNTSWLDNVAKNRDSALDTANLAKEQAVTDNYGKLRNLPSDQSGTGLKILESGVGEAAKNDSISKYKEPGEVDRFRYMSQKLTPFSGNKEVDTALGNAQATAKMEQDSAERQAARDAAEQAQADRERAADERLNSRLDAQRIRDERAALEKAERDARNGIDPSTGKPFTSQAIKAGKYAIPMGMAIETIDELTAGGFSESALNNQILAAFKKNPKMSSVQIMNFARDPQQQRYLQAQLDFMVPYLRDQSGAAINADEYADEIARHFGRAGDTPEVVSQKRSSRIAAFAAQKEEAGPMYDRLISRRDSELERLNAKRDGRAVSGGGGADPVADPVKPAGLYLDEIRARRAAKGGK